MIDGAFFAKLNLNQKTVTSSGSAFLEYSILVLKQAVRSLLAGVVLYRNIRHLRYDGSSCGMNFRAGAGNDVRPGGSVWNRCADVRGHTDVCCGAAHSEQVCFPAFVHLPEQKRR